MRASRIATCSLVAELLVPSILLAQTPAGTAFTYQGQLRQSGTPVSGSADFQFSLWDDPNSADPNDQVGSTLSELNVDVDNGLFAVKLDFGASVFTGEARWLEVAVRTPAGGGAYTTLTPRQELTPAPYSICALDIPDGAVTTAKLADSAVTTAKIADYAVNSYKLGDGAVITQKLNDYAVTTKLGSIAGYSLDTDYDGTLVTLTNGYWEKTTLNVRADQNNGTAVNAYADEGGIALRGGTWTGDGVYGFCNNTASNAGNAVNGYSKGGNGVYGESDSDCGVYGIHNNTSGTVPGVHGETNSSTNGSAGTYGEAVAATGTTYGVYGYSASQSGRGVYGFAWAPAGTNYGVYGKTSSASGYGVYAEGDMGCSGTKSFRIDHPFDPANLYLKHYCAEGPAPLNIYSGTVVLDAEGEAWVELPGYFDEINRDFRYQLTPIGAPMPQLHVAREVADNLFQIAGGQPGARVSWQVTGVRNDPYVRAYGAPVEQEKPESERGRYLHPELYGQPEEMGLHFSPEPQNRN
jgi:hypothetical protein